MSNSRIRNQFLAENQGKSIRLIFGNGFQLCGKLLDHDELNMLIETPAYSSDPVVVPFAAVTTYAPAKK